MQCVACGIDSVDAVLFTHHHRDQASGVGSWVGVGSGVGSWVGVGSTVGSGVGAGVTVGGSMVGWLR